MKSWFGSIGRRGVTLLAVAGVAGLLLAVHGWMGRGSASPLGSIGSAGAAVGRAAGHASRAAANSASPTPSAGASASTPGPLLSAQSFAAYAVVIWPGTRSPAAQAALAGLSINVHRQGNGLLVSAAVNGQQSGAPHFYPLGTRVYVIEASLGDDSGNSDYNLGDDGLVVTDAHGRIVT